jgi:uncharacterized protein YkwD
VHHRSARPARPVRSSRPALRTGAPRRSRAGRLAWGALVSTAVASFVLAAPVVTGIDDQSTSGVFTSFASPAPEEPTQDSPVVMGVDGGPRSSTFAGAAAAGTTAADVPSQTPAPAPTEAAAPPPPAPPVVEAPAEVTEEPEPAPVEVVEEPAPTPAPSAAAAPAPAPPAADSSTEGQVLALVNAERAANGCGAVVADQGLAAVARAHSADMRDRGYFDHTNPSGLDPFDRADAAGVDARAENIAMGQRDAADVMDSWMNSSGHRANILNCKLTKLGVGVAEGDGGPWWTQLFG